MKNYEERTNDVLNKIAEYEKQNEAKTPQTAKAPKAAKKAKTPEIYKPVYRSSRGGVIAAVSTAAAALVLIIAITLVLFLPYPDSKVNIGAYKDSDYYELIKVINDLTYSKPPYKNNFEAWFGSATGGINGSGNKGETSNPSDSDGAVPPAGADAPGSSNGSYEETTNNQVDGVIEGDLLKRSSDYAYYLLPHSYEYKNNCFILRVYRLAGNDTALVSEHEISPDENSYFYFQTPEMYLTEDCRSLILILPCNLNNRAGTCLIGLDVTSPEEVKETARVYVSGNYVSSRMTDDLLLFTNFTVYSNPDFSNESEFLPQTGSADDMTSLPIENICFSPDANYARYAVACKINLSTLEIDDTLAFLSYSENAYVSKDNIFLTRTGREIINTKDYKNRDFSYSKNYTEISCINYAGEGLDLKGSFSVDGTVLNQYSMDEYENVFRVAATTTNLDSTETYTTTGTSASLYCVNLQNFEIIGKTENFAPKGESVRSARFDKEKAYVCTAVVNTDPVFAFDLSDYNNITYKRTPDIDGFSTSLIKFTNGTLLGIGEEWGDLKIEIYGETETSVDSLAKYTLDCSFSRDFKAYYIDAERELIGLGTYIYRYNIDIRESRYCYMLFAFDGEKIQLAKTVNYGEERVNYDGIRTAYDDGFIYVFSEAGVNVINYDAE